MKSTIWNDIWEFLCKYAFMILTVGATSTMRVIIDNHHRRLTKWGILAKFFIAFMCGVLVSNYCLYNGYTKAMVWAGPLGSLAGESLITYLSFHWNSIYKFMLKKWTGMKDEDFKEKEDEEKPL